MTGAREMHTAHAPGQPGYWLFGFSSVDSYPILVILKGAVGEQSLFFVFL